MKMPDRKQGAKALKVDPKDIERVKNQKSVDEILAEFRAKTQADSPEFIDSIKSQYLKLITSHPDFPRNKVTFYDIISPLADPSLFTGLMTLMSFNVPQCDVVIAPESRGFVFGPTIAAMIGAGFIPARKEGKLPADNGLATITYDTEYSSEVLQISLEAIHYAEDYKYHHEEEIQKAHKNEDGTVEVEHFKHEPLTAVIVDDILATGGTLEALVSLVKAQDIRVITTVTIAEIESLGGRKFLEKKGISNFSLLKL